MPRDVSLVITAAGESTRMKSAVRKPFLDLGGRPVLYVTLEKFARIPRIGQVILALNRADYDERDKLLSPEPPLAITDLVVGGRTRTQSVANALAALSPAARVVLIHDAVRPFVKPEVIKAVIASAEEHGAAIAAAPVRDTLKRVKDGTVTETVAREGLYCAQTPQGFRRKVIEKAYRAVSKGDFSDDALLVELFGGRVAIVESPHDNIKITTPEDLAIARAIISLPR